MWEQSLYDARILIVDDQLANVRLLERILQQAGYLNVQSTTDPSRMRTLYAEFQPDLILLDLHMPGLDGFTVMHQLNALIAKQSYLPILILTADISPDIKRRALAVGAKDFLTKPFDAVEALLRIKNLLETRLLYLQLQNQNQILEQKVSERTQALEEAHAETLERLARAAEYRDDVTGQHTQRVGRLSALVAQALGLPPEEVALIRQAAPLHDVGKIGIPDGILLKPGKLTVEEFEAVKRHTTIGATLLSRSRSKLLMVAEQIALTHHERWDGTGYPQKLGSEEIPMVGRIVAVVDVFDALVNERPYKHAWPAKDAVAELKSQKNRQFDAAVVEAFLHVLDSERLW